MSHVESKEEMFVDANEDMQENQFQEIDTDNGTQEDDDLSVVKGFMVGAYMLKFVLPI